MLLKQNIAQRFVHLFLCTFLLTVVASAALAQGLPPNMSFTSNGSGTFSSTGGAIRGSVTGSVFGRIRDGQVTDLAISMDPQASLRGKLSFIKFTEDSLISARWYAVSGGGRKLVLSNVPGYEVIHGAGLYYRQSHGRATIEITFTSGVGRVVIKDYRHSYFSSTGVFPTPIQGGICDSYPLLTTHRLTYRLL